MLNEKMHANGFLYWPNKTNPWKKILESWDFVKYFWELNSISVEIILKFNGQISPYVSTVLNTTF